jgi:hypothetical protein
MPKQVFRGVMIAIFWVGFGVIVGLMIGDRSAIPYVFSTVFVLWLVWVWISANWRWLASPAAPSPAIWLRKRT